MTNMHKETVITTDAPGAIGPYSQAVKAWECPIYFRTTRTRPG